MSYISSCPWTRPSYKTCASDTSNDIHAKHNSYWSPVQTRGSNPGIWDSRDLRPFYNQSQDFQIPVRTYNKELQCFIYGYTLHRLVKYILSIAIKYGVSLKYRTFYLFEIWYELVNWNISTYFHIFKLFLKVQASVPKQLFILNLLRFSN